MARSVRDAALLLDALAGYDPNDPITAYSVGQVPTTYTSFLQDGLRGMRIGVVREPIAPDTDTSAEDYQQIWAAIDRAVAAMANRGAEVVDPVPFAAILEILRRPGASGEREAAFDEYLAAHPNAPVATLREVVESPDHLVLPAQRSLLAEGLGQTTDDPRFLRALLNRDQLRQELLKTMADNGLDALTYPTLNHNPALIPADIMTTSEVQRGRGGNNALSPAVGFPAITVPAGFTIVGLPIGISFMGRPFSEGVLFRIAHGHEQTGPYRIPPLTVPPLPGEP